MEHLVQAFQIWALGWPIPKAGGVLGFYFPSLISSELMHYGYALVMLAGLWVLRDGFTGPAKLWWTISLYLQFWHHVEHLILILQVTFSFSIAASGVPTSFLQLLIPRVELHLFYNAVVTVPMVIAMFMYGRPSVPVAEPSLVSRGQ